MTGQSGKIKWRLNSEARSIRETQTAGKIRFDREVFFGNCSVSTSTRFPCFVAHTWFSHDGDHTPRNRAFGAEGKGVSRESVEKRGAWRKVSFVGGLAYLRWFEE